MNHKEFFKLVEQMRYKQKLYFKTRSQVYLYESKFLEKQLDDEIERVNKITKNLQ